MSHPSCCPPGSWPQSLLHSRDELNQDTRPFTFKGTVESIGAAGIRAYSVGTATKGAILVFQDIYSSRVLHPSSRSGDRYVPLSSAVYRASLCITSRLDAICDVLADAGYAVCMPSLFGDEPFDLAIKAPDDGDFEKFNSFAQEGGVAWFQQQTYEKLKPIVQVGIEALKAKMASDDKPIMVLGFCFGTWLLSKASADFTFQAAVGCHPATTLETAVYQGDEIAMLQALRQPTLFLWSGNDSNIFLGDSEGKKALAATGGGVEEFPDMLHGWVSRGDVSEATVKRDFEKAMAMIVSFMDTHAR